MIIERDDLTRAQVRALLDEHLRSMQALSPPESVHALDIGKLRAPGITFWSAWEHGELLGCGALKQLDPTHGEIKSMRTAPAHRRKGVGRAMLLHILGEARRRAYERLSLETGAMAAFVPAQQLYRSFGFTFCEAFAGYAADPHSVFMTRVLGACADDVQA